MADEQEQGALLQGEDGSVFFIPADRLNEFRVSDEDSAGVREALAEVDDDEVSGFKMGQERSLKQGVTQLRAFQGPLGLKPPVMRINEGDGIWVG